MAEAAIPMQRLDEEQTSDFEDADDPVHEAIQSNKRRSAITRSRAQRAYALVAVVLVTLGILASPSSQPPLAAQEPPLSVTLSDGRQMPHLALGTGGRDKAKYASGDAYPVVTQALALGIRHIDCAAFYGDEAEVGRAIRDSGVPRADIWLTSKLPVGPETTGLGFNETLDELRASLGRFGLEYLDLYLIHSPFDRAHRVEQWHALQHAKVLGLTRSIGVSNYGVQHLAELDGEPEQPVVNQIELHPWLQQRAIVAACQARGIVVEAYGPLGPTTHWHDPNLVRIAERHGRPVQQVLLSWSLASGHVPIFSTVNPEHLRSNVDAQSLRLNSMDVASLREMDAGEHVFWDPTGAP